MTRRNIRRDTELFAGIATIVIAGAGLVFAPGCEETPAERAADRIEERADRVEEAGERAADRLENLSDRVEEMDSETLPPPAPPPQTPPRTPSQTPPATSPGT